ncbi:MAG TPA: zinc metalloprotease HtpX [Vicinamibacterales bacterium]|nr:zinc metalloprotease HtpX [Acidobacteriota bacterium]HQX83019.1 zinc metalloprotease HtpX [Vicinamibacterales bacterium]
MSGLKTVVLLGALSGLFLTVGTVLGGQSGLVIAFGIAVVMNIGSYWFSDKIVLKMYRAQEVQAGHRLYDMTARLARRAELPMPKVYVIPDMSPNAFATGRNPQHAAVAATEGIMRLLSDSELEGVMAHELAHVKNRDILISSVAATIGAAITMLAQFAMFFGGGGRDRENGPSPIALIATMLLAPIAASLIQMAVSRSREFVADRTGAQIAGSPVGLAQALKRLEAGSKQIPMDANQATAHMFIVSPLTGKGFSSLFSTHPPTQARVDALMRLQFQ